MDTTSSIFEYPELIEQLCMFLTPRSIAHCVATCKAFHAQFTPHLWRHITSQPHVKYHYYGDDDDDHISKSLIERVDASEPQMMALKMNLHHIRTLDLVIFAQYFIGHIARRGTCTHLTRLRVMGGMVIEGGQMWMEHDGSCPTQSILYLMQSNPFLTSLELPGKILITDPYGDKFLRIQYDDEDQEEDEELNYGSGEPISEAVLLLSYLLPKLRHLKRFTLGQIHYNRYMDGEDLTVDLNPMFKILRTCLAHPSLEEVHMLFKVNFSAKDSVASYQTKLLEKAERNDRALNDIVKNQIPDLCKQKPVANLKTLCLPGRDDLLFGPKTFPESILFPLVEHCLSSLERFDVPELKDEAAYKRLAQLLKAHCPKIRHLTGEHIFIDNRSPYPLSDFGLIQVFQACQGLETFRLKNFVDSGKGVLEALAAMHGSTLKSLELMDSDKVKSVSVRAVLTSCSRLEKCEFGETYQTYASIHVRDVGGIGSPTWACSRTLKTLSILLDGMTDPETSVEARYKVFGQIGACTALETLKIGYCDRTYNMPPELVGWFFKVETDLDDGHYDSQAGFGGLLNLLASLKNLRRFQMVGRVHEVMGQGEVEFMMREWPRFREVCFSAESEYHFEEIINREHWKWLQANAPLVALRSYDVYNY